MIHIFSLAYTELSIAEIVKKTVVQLFAILRLRQYRSIAPTRIDGSVTAQ